jgi:hypothetical protein
MNGTLTHYGEGLVEIITDRYTVWDYVDEGTGYGEFEGTKAECEGFMANAQPDNYTRLEISESGYDNHDGLMGIYPALRDGHTRNGIGCIGPVRANFNEGLAEDFYPSRAMVASMERRKAKEAEAKKRQEALEHYGVR